MSKQLADRLTQGGPVQPGPELPEVLDAWIQGGDGGCHVGSQGQQAFGAAVAGVDWSSS